MKLYNTLTRKTDELTPLTDNTVRIYSCGPTVYDHIHIGNLSAFIMADTLRRTIEASGFKAAQVMNFTDVDDKTIRRSHQQHPELPAREALRKLTEYYTDRFLEDMRLVGNDVTRFDFINATNDSVMEGMRALIRQLHADGFAYIADDGVYFSIEAYKNSGKIYGQLSHITTSSTSEARIQNDEYDKEAAHDFALWKLQKPGEPAWDFELDGQNLVGRPGWHIECSVMSAQKLGQPFDIHTGGVDLIFPHHENEIAQSTAGQTDPVYATRFVHNEHILVDGKKMSKSLHNFYTLQDITSKGYDPLAFRLLVLQSHYRSQTHFSWENLDASQNRLTGYRQMADQRWQTRPDGQVTAAELDAARADLLRALQDDLNTAQALALVSQLQTAIDTGGINTASQATFADFLAWLDGVLGTQLTSGTDISDSQRALIDQRDTARAAKDWATSDAVRDQLAEQGIGLRDTPQGAVWFRL